MSMIGHFQAVSPRLLEALKRGRVTVHDVLNIPTGFGDGQLDLGPLIPGAARKSIEGMLSST